MVEVFLSRHVEEPTPHWLRIGAFEFGAIPRLGETIYAVAEGIETNHFKVVEVMHTPVPRGEVPEEDVGLVNVFVELLPHAVALPLPRG